MSLSPDFRLPDLRFVPTEDVYPHEFNDPQRTGPLVRRLRESGVMKNPPIVAQVGDGQRIETRYIVLDGANRSTAAKAAGWPHVVVQVVRYEQPWVQLSTWYHALTAETREHLEQGLARIEGLERTHMDRIHGRALLARRLIMANAKVDLLSAY